MENILFLSENHNEKKWMNEQINKTVDFMWKRKKPEMKFAYIELNFFFFLKQITGIVNITNI